MTEIETARAALDAGKIDAAEEICHALLSEKGDGMAQAICILGIVALMRGNYPDALASFAQALQEGYVADTLLLNNYGEAYRRVGSFDKAFECFSQALHLDTQQPYTYFNIALTRRAQGNARESEHYFRLAFLVKPDFPRAHAELAELYLEEGHFEEAIAEYREAIALAVSGHSKEVHCGVEKELLSHWYERLAFLLLIRGSTVEAISVAEQSIALNCENAAAWREIAKAKFELCHESAAMESYENSLKIDPGQSVHKGRRILAARRRAPAEWAGLKEGVRYLPLARSQMLQVVAPPTIPAGFSGRFELGHLWIHELFSLRLTNAEILHGDFSVVTEDRTLLLDGIVNRARQYERKSRYVKHASDDMRMLLDLPSGVATYNGECILLGGGGDQYAWYFEALARLWAVEQQPQLASLPLAVDAGIDQGRIADLALFGYPEERLVLVDSKGIKVTDLYVPSLCVSGDCISPVAIQYLRRRLMPAPQSGRRRIYLSRMSCEVRRLANEEDILPVLRSRGFEVLDMASLSANELPRLFSEADAILAMDDEMLAGLVVAPQGAHIGVIATEGIYNARAYLVSSQLAHDFVYLVGLPDFESHAVHENCDVRLPEESLNLFLERL